MTDHYSTSTISWLKLMQFKVSARIAVARGTEKFILQSSDAEYSQLLEVTKPINRRYARRHGYGYFSFEGKLLKTSQSSNFHRYFLLRELQRLRQLRWGLWIDADAMIIDHSVKMESIILPSQRKMLIACEGRGPASWDINNGVFFLNMHHKLTSMMLHFVIGYFGTIPSDNQKFCSDQAILHRWLSSIESLGQLNEVLTCYSGSCRDLFNYDGKFVRHILRASGNYRSRVETLRALSNQILAFEDGSEVKRYELHD